MSSIGSRGSFGDSREWSTQEKLALASLVLKLGNNNWGKISKSLKETIEEAGLNKHGREYNVKECASVYQILSDALQPKKKRSEQTNAVSMEPAKQIVHNLTMERMSELRKSMEREQREFKRMKREIEGVVKGTINHQQIRQMLEDQKQEDLRDGLSDLASSDEEDYDGDVMEDLEPSLELPQNNNKGPTAAEIIKDGDLIQSTEKNEVKQGGKEPTTINEKQPIESNKVESKPSSGLNGTQTTLKKTEEPPIQNLSLQPKEISVSAVAPTPPVSINGNTVKSPRKSGNPPEEIPVVAQEKPKPTPESGAKGAKPTVRSSPRSPRLQLPQEPEPASKPKQTRRSTEKIEEKAASSSSEEIKNTRDPVSPPKEEENQTGTLSKPTKEPEVDSAPKNEPRRRSSKRDSRNQETPAPQPPKSTTRKSKDPVEPKEDATKKTAVVEEKPARGKSPRKSATVTAVGKGKAGKAALKFETRESVEPVIPQTDEFKQWKKRADLAMRGIMEHKHANIFNSPVTEKIAPHYSEYVHCKADLESIRKDLETGAIQTTSALCYQLNLLFCNAVMYNGTNSNVNNWAKEMSREVFVIFKKIMTANESEISAAETAKNRRSGRHQGTDSPRSTKKRNQDRESSKGLDETFDGPLPKRAR